MFKGFSSFYCFEDLRLANLPIFCRITQGAAERMKRDKMTQERNVEERRQTNRFASSSSSASEALPTMTNSAVAKMMAAMGHKAGQGLGKHGQGITTNISVHQRKKNEGLGNTTEHKMELEPKKVKEEPVSVSIHFLFQCDQSRLLHTILAATGSVLQARLLQI